MNKLVLSVFLSLFTLPTLAATGLAIITKDAQCAGKPVKDCTAEQTYSTPVNGDYVRVSPTNLADWSSTQFVFKKFDDLAEGEKYEGCADAVEGTSINAPGACAIWPWIPKQTSLVTVDTKVYRHTDARDKITIAAAGSVALNVKCDATQSVNGMNVVPQAAVKFQTSTKYVISLVKCAVAAPPPVVTPPVDPPPSTGDARKNNPGHYIRSQEAAWASQRAARRGYYDLMAADPAIKGGLLLVPWGAVETAKGVYDFSEIDADVAYVRSKGKKLLIEIWWMDFWHAIPGTPQGGDKWLPDYIIAGGGARSMLYGGFIAKIDEAAWMDRLIALNNALAARYDSNPDVEQLIMTETSNADTSKGQFDRLIVAMGTAWKRTGTTLYANWVATPDDARRLAALRAQYGVGFGGPDIIPGQPQDETHEALVSRGAGVVSVKDANGKVVWTGDYGKTDYRGKVPMSYSYEVLGEMPPKMLIDYAKSTLKATHIAWAAPSWFESADLNWPGVLAVIKANPTLVTACPSAYRCAP